MSLQYIALLLVVLLATTAVRNQAVGVWTPISDISDPHVTDIANFAVTEHDKSVGEKLKLEKVISGETKVLDGTTWCLNISTSDGNALGKYNIVVLEKDTSKTLNAFTPLQA